ncbi:MAG: DUF4861 domain-containing protein [Prevotella sp.]|nr:DUF4861 domain-containing protein [Prevotella sp.]
MNTHTLGLILSCLCLSAQAQTSLTVTVENPSDQARRDQPVVVDLRQHGTVASARVTLNGSELPSQLDDLDMDEQYDELCFLADLGPRQTNTYTVELMPEGEPRTYKARTFAELLVRNSKVKEKNRHDNYLVSITARGDAGRTYDLLHHHGVAFESELTGVRIYFDQRQTLDLYGKRKQQLELRQTQFYPQPDQLARGYGDDVLWVGNSFGLGAMRGWDGTQPTMIDNVKSRTQRLISSGPLRAIVEVVDQGWLCDPAKPRLNMTLRYTQWAGHRDFTVDVTFNRDASDYRFSTGLINVKGSEEYSDHKGLRACWGSDYPTGDSMGGQRETVGLAILLDGRNIVSELPADRVEQGGNLPFVVSPQGRSMRYHLSFCSAKEELGPQAAGEWFDMLKAWKRDVEQPVNVSVQTK